MVAKLGNFLDLQDQAGNATTAEFTALKELGQEQSRQLSALDKSSGSQALKAVDLSNNLLRQLAEDVRHVKYQMSSPSPPNALDPTKECPILLEDALGLLPSSPVTENVKTESVGGNQLKKFIMVLTVHQDPTDALREAIDFEAPVPVDKVYGLLGLFPASVQRWWGMWDVVKAYLDQSQDSDKGIDLGFFCSFPPFVQEKPLKGDHI
ncbi:hypothetical protein B0T25DRAFT_582548 [Lasiosphaeria hispida]|uniref:Uncharacterized protein n=1 Tax=Lasiosphaeria hispida TaxID=260671 RepID=A0AAJ0HFI2_9PEZI|nr:hypothetical protein B0T25DRAFT_582548 [Lasiosphaeria hispida]